MIDWTKPVETTEDPPRPVRVLCTDAGEQYPIVALISRYPILFTKDGNEFANGCGITLRNVAPKPETVLMEAWVVWDADGYETVWCKEKDAADRARHFRGVYARAAVMSDGSPVPGEASGEDAPLIGLSDAEFRRLCDNVEAPLIAERDHWRAKAEALQAEVDKRNDSILDHLERIQAMKPVVDAAVAWASQDQLGRLSHIRKAVRAYQQQAPAEPVKTCETCALYERVHDHECAKDDSLRRPNNSCSDWQPDRDDDISRVYEEAKAETCPTCNGKGKVMMHQRNISSVGEGYRVCPDCNGTGKKEKK